MLEEKVNICKEEGKIDQISYKIKKGKHVDEIIRIAEEYGYDIVVVEVEDPINAGEIIAIPDAATFNITFLVGSLSFTCYDPDNDNQATTSDLNWYAAKQIISATWLYDNSQRVKVRKCYTKIKD